LHKLHQLNLRRNEVVRPRHRRRRRGWRVQVAV
jgi:hypothetical protein